MALFAQLRIELSRNRWWAWFAASQYPGHCLCAVLCPGWSADFEDGPAPPHLEIPWRALQELGAKQPRIASLVVAMAPDRASAHVTIRGAANVVLSPDAARWTSRSRYKVHKRERLRSLCSSPPPPTKRLPCPGYD